MPRVKINYVVSFSSEDPDHPASNLLLRDVSKKKWLCKRGESSCSVVLQLPRAVKITGVHIGAYHAALVQVLVGRSETSSEQFQVLVPTSVFVTRAESRSDVPAVRVRSFGAAALGAARSERWDRVRVVCEQPHNKHCQFGLSFVHIDEAAAEAPGAAPPRALALDTFSSDEDEFKPGELFAKHLQNTSGEVQSNRSSNTGMQIRQATAQALKNINEVSTKLIKTPISKPSVKRAPSPTSERSDQEADTLNNTHQKPKHVSKSNDEPKRNPKRNKSESPPRPQENNDKPTSAQHKDKEVRKRRRSSSEEQAGAHGAPHTLLRGAVLVLSGYAHPHRARVRALAQALGARVRPDWGPGCTHLICAFPNTPKLRAVRAGGAGRGAGGAGRGAGGAGRGAPVPVARAEWLEHMSRRRRLLPWRWFATEQQHLIQPTPEQLLDDDDAQPASRQTDQEPDSDGDTDDEIEKVLQDQKRRRLYECNVSSDEHKRGDRPASHELRTECRDAGDEESTDEEAPPPAPPAPEGALPDFFAGYTFAVDAAPEEARRLARYVRAYGGLALPMSEVGEDSEVDYIVRGRGAAGASGAGEQSVRSVSAAWLARCHEAKALVPH